ncbi:MAG TPA: TldD/PmbA family protein [Ignavibacteria bacterium]|mgnify:CR=1 FL=1|nr:TldD/PmbA family protein [Ignavibacteria bacterium]
MLLTKEEAKSLSDKILSYSKADSAIVTLSGGNTTNLRFAQNTVSTCGAVDSISINIRSNFGKKSGSISITSADDKDLENAVLRSEEIAILSPDNKEFLPPPGKQDVYLEVDEFFEDTENLSPKDISDKISYTLNKASEKDLTAAGYFECGTEFFSVSNTNGLFAYHKNTTSQFSSTMRTKDTNGSSKINREYADINLLNVRKFSDRVAENAILSGNPEKHDAGKFVAILDSAAVSDIIDRLIGSMNKRSADEGRSFFSDKDKGNKIGQKISNSKVNIISDPQLPEAPSTPFNYEGMPEFRTEWITDGVLKNLYSTRYWAEKTQSEFVSYPNNIYMKGTDKTVEDLIASTERGIYVNRFWYIRDVDPSQLLLTGLTRDGVFLIENGKIKHAINNFRFNESPINILNNVIDMSVTEKVVGSETDDAKIVVPALKLSEFNFSTISDAT